MRLAVLGRMQFTLHETRRTPHGDSRLVQAMPAWLVKTRRAPSRDSRDARVYGHTTTAMHKLITTLPPPPARTRQQRLLASKPEMAEPGGSTAAAAAGCVAEAAAAGCGAIGALVLALARRGRCYTVRKNVKPLEKKLWFGERVLNAGRDGSFTRLYSEGS